MDKYNFIAKYLYQALIIFMLCVLSCILTTVSAKMAFTKIEYNINGISGEILENVSERLELLKKNMLNQPNTKNINFYYSNINEAIKSSISPYGYFSSIISIKYKNKQDTQFTTIAITLGSPVIIGSITIDITGEGKSHDTLKEVIKNIPLKQGNIFNSITYETVKQQLLSWASKNGFIHAYFIKKIVDVNSENNNANINLYFDTKIRYYFGKINIIPNPFSEDLIRKYLSFNSSDVFTSNNMLQSHNNLTDSSLFQIIQISPQFNHIYDKKYIPINVILKPKKIIGLQTGIGYGTNSGMDSHVNLDFRRINSQGHSIKTNVQYSELIQNVGIKYIIPGINPIHDNFVIDSNAQKINVDVGKSKIFQFSVGLSRKKVTWNKTISLIYLNEEYTIYKDDDKIKEDEHFKANLIMPKLSIITKFANDNFFPSKGYKISAEIFGANKSFLSNVSFLQTNLKIDSIFTLGTIRFVQRNKFGSIFFLNTINKLPLSLQFLEGGTKSVRGYNYHSIGYGRYMFVSSLDIQLPVYKNWYLTTFYDIGNVFNSFDEELKSSVGTSIMLKSGIGPVNLGFAKGLEKGAPKFRIYFSIGVEI